MNRMQKSSPENLIKKKQQKWKLQSIGAQGQKNQDKNSYFSFTKIIMKPKIPSFSQYVSGSHKSINRKDSTSLENRRKLVGLPERKIKRLFKKASITAFKVSITEDEESELIPIQRIANNNYQCEDRNKEKDPTNGNCILQERTKIQLKKSQKYNSSEIISYEGQVQKRNNDKTQISDRRRGQKYEEGEELANKNESQLFLFTSNKYEKPLRQDSVKQSSLSIISHYDVNVKFIQSSDEDVNQQEEQKIKEGRDKQYLLCCNKSENMKDVSTLEDRSQEKSLFFEQMQQAKGEKQKEKDNIKGPSLSQTLENQRQTIDDLKKMIFKLNQITRSTYDQKIMQAKIISKKNNSFKPLLNPIKSSSVHQRTNMNQQGVLKKGKQNLSYELEKNKKLINSLKRSPQKLQIHQYIQNARQQVAEGKQVRFKVDLCN